MTFTVYICLQGLQGLQGLQLATDSLLNFTATGPVRSTECMRFEVLMEVTA